MSSQINPSNVNANYPVAGVSNNTQGFRDNFAAIQTNFQYAENEINDLQNNGVFKAALTGTTLDNNFNDNLIYAVQLSDVSWQLVTLTATSGTISLDYSAANWYVMPSQTGNTTLAFSNWPTSGTAGTLRFRIVVSNTAYTLTVPAAVSLGTAGIQGWASNVITFAATGTYDFEFTTIDGGTTVCIQDLLRPQNYFTNAVNVAATTASTSTTSGALIVAGGVGVGGNVNIAGNLSVTGNATLSGNIVADRIVNGTTEIAVQTANGNANVTVGGVSNVAVFTTTGLSITGNVVATANVTGGNITTAGLITATGNITATANVSGGNLITGGRVVSTGNVVATANVTGGNITTAGLITATGSVTGGNLITGGFISATGNVRLLASTAIPAGGTAGAGLRMSSTTNLGIFFGSGAPTLSAAQGSLYLRTDGTTTNDRMYVNTNGSTTWTAVTTVA